MHSEYPFLRQNLVIKTESVIAGKDQDSDLEVCTEYLKTFCASADRHASSEVEAIACSPSLNLTKETSLEDKKNSCISFLFKLLLLDCSGPIPAFVNPDNSNGFCD